MSLKKQSKVNLSRIPHQDSSRSFENLKIVFSFERLVKNELFNIDGTCPSWPATMIDMLKQCSTITMKQIHSGEFSGRHSTLRIHDHRNARPPECGLPQNVSLEEMFQIRFGTSSGGIHGIFSENVFYVIWLDPFHNLYPDEHHGGVKKITPPRDCCIDLREENDSLHRKIDELTLKNSRLESELNELLNN